MTPTPPPPARSLRSGWPLPLPMELLLTALKRAAHFTLQTGFNLPGFIYLASVAMEKSGCRRAAAGLYERALTLADSSSSRRVFMIRQAWEFAAERNWFRMGASRVHDPIFQVAACPERSSVGLFSRRFAAGYYEVHVSHRGLRVDGYLRPGIQGRKLHLFIDGKLMRETSVSRPFPGLYLFVMSIRRDALAVMPMNCKLELRLAGGEPLLFRGSAVTNLVVPHAMQNQSDSNEPVRLDKKGFLVRPKGDVTQLQRGFLDIYAAASRFFETELGIPLFVLYGTLLGQHRQGDFIPGDDDFDVGYYSDAGTSAEVRSQGMDFVVKLVAAGFVVTLNRQGRLFRLRLPGMPPNCHLDVHAVWCERGSLWIHPRANLDCVREDFLPVHTALLGDAQVAVPARPESFLAAYYGPNWRVPDPAYSTAARAFPRWKTHLLRQSCVTAAHVKEMQKRISEIPAPVAGMLLAIGIQSIYPLDRYEELCDW